MPNIRIGLEKIERSKLCLMSARSPKRMLLGVSAFIEKILYQSCSRSSRARANRFILNGTWNMLLRQTVWGMDKRR